MRIDLTLTLLIRETNISEEKEFYLSHSIDISEMKDVLNEIKESILYGNVLRDVQREYNYYSVRHIPCMKEINKKDF